MKKYAVLLLLGFGACKKDQIVPPYRGDLISIKIESDNSTLYINNQMMSTSISKLDTNIWLFANDTICVLCPTNLSDTQSIKCLVNLNKFYSTTYYKGVIHDSVNACPSWSRIKWEEDTMKLTIVYRYKS